MDGSSDMNVIGAFTSFPFLSQSVAVSSTVPPIVGMYADAGVNVILWAPRVSVSFTYTTASAVYVRSSTTVENLRYAVPALFAYIRNVFCVPSAVTVTASVLPEMLHVTAPSIESGLPYALIVISPPFTSLTVSAEIERPSKYVVSLTVIEQTASMSPHFATSSTCPVWVPLLTPVEEPLVFVMVTFVPLLFLSDHWMFAFATMFPS